MLPTLCTLIVVIAAILQHSSPETTEDTPRPKIPLYLGGFFSFGGPWDGSGVLPAVDMALDHINAKEDVLPEYELRMVWNDTQVSFISEI